jgi:hypothetical protein
MNGRHGITIVAAVSSFQLVGMAGLHAAEGPAAFDCSKDRTALAVTVCNDEATIAAERRTMASYLAAYYALPEARRPGFRSDHMQWLNSLTNRCARLPNLRPAEQPSLSVECVRKLYAQRGDVYREKLTGLALEESNLSSILLKKLQKRLIELKLLSGDVDGVFGANTRAAIRNYQASVDHVQSNFLSAEERNMLLDPSRIQAQGAESKPTIAHEPISTAEATNPSGSQSLLQSLDNRPLQPDTSETAIEQTPKESPLEPAIEQTPKENPPDAVSFPASTDVVAPVDARSKFKTRYFIEGGTIAAVILVLAVDSLLIRLRRRINFTSRRANTGEDLSGVSLKTDTVRIMPSMQGRQVRAFSSLKSAGSNLDNAGGTATAVQRDARRA